MAKHLLMNSAAGEQVHRTLVDNGNSINILHTRTLRQMEISERYFQPYPTKLQGFSRDPIQAQGQIALLVELYEAPRQRRILADFVVVDLPSNYNAILGRPMLHEVKVVTSIYHYNMKFSTPYGVRIIRENQLEARACNIDLPKLQIHMLGSEQHVRAKEARLKRPIVADLAKIGISEKYCQKPMDDHVSFDDKEADPNPYPEVL